MVKSDVKVDGSPSVEVEGYEHCPDGLAGSCPIVRQVGVLRGSLSLFGRVLYGFRASVACRRCRSMGCVPPEAWEVADGA